MKTFHVYPLDGQMFSVELPGIRVNEETLRIYSGTADHLTAMLDDERIAAVYAPNEAPSHEDLRDDQPKLFRVYLRNHTDSPIKIHAHFFKKLDQTLEFYYKQPKYASHPFRVQLQHEEVKVDDVYVKLSEVIAIDFLDLTSSA